ncbi:hypothetical protein A2704_07010 [Candidatus Kaiserbacteria bacterium RIFCSPHIGHO2_01_FULL_54_36b]|uniref:Uncharacterized protein n=1 Tax=Candidatus Kaiserbacteria bacterium RIFCSPHIGHO2_01_FULL_54_36b TaxID=1798483 RepID=A0A1F6CRD7_9BACT|nr:MAG: hypothetical protein A2704_07010 [Candidatus Kaiserbacteria bacterium RIFCSPHIGHO2_01_FULL_54_36b]
MFIRVLWWTAPTFHSPKVREDNMATVLKFKRANQAQDFSDIRAAVKRLAQDAVNEALRLALTRHPKSYHDAPNAQKATAGAGLATSMLEQAIVEVRTATVAYLAAKEIAG